ncbi:MAG TPA: DUF3427 domain-containing protein [Spirochaetia bacterium]|nr:DUF3427 domain-containing protein [Spirochaetia bacterium]
MTPSATSCPFCSPDPDRVVFETELVRALWDAFAVSPGHLLLVPRRHVAHWFSATAREQAALIEALPRAREAVLEQHLPDGFNIGINVGEAAGQTVPHLHLHLIPRFTGDMEDPTGGVRGVIPQRQNYQKLDLNSRSGSGDTATGEVVPLPYRAEPSLAPRLVRGDDDPLLPHLTRDLARAHALDLAVAFVLKSGVNALEPHLRDILARREGRVRLVTGDYLDVTEPEALAQLRDLSDESTGTLELRVFETKNQSFHPKAYLIHHSERHQSAYVGSSNLTRTALQSGVEWNYRVDSAVDAAGVEEAAAAFEQLFRHPATVEVTEAWLRAYRERRRPVDVSTDVPPEPPVPRPEPHEIQAEALEALAQTREEGNQAGLVVLATGLGKTYLSAFDVERTGVRRVLFVAHRDEILQQARRAFRDVFPNRTLGLYTGKQKEPDAEVVFASVQTLSRQQNIHRFAPDAFDYVIIDEFHHANAKTYRRIIDYLDPGFLLGLTATPDRTDGGDLLSLCGENLVFECNLVEGIRRDRLAPFQYFGVPDDVDYENIPWRSGRFDEEALTQALATQVRAQNAYEQWEGRAGERTLAFCCSQVHARFMRGFFRAHGVGAAAVYAAPDSDPRAESLRALEAGEIEVLFAVDMFNEGLDVPAVDTVMMLRPTESRILWLQQLGRGLRKAEGKTELGVIDYIGNHRAFLLKAETLLLALGDEDVSRGALRERLRQVAAGELSLPEGCAVTYETEVVNIFNALLQPTTREDALRLWVQDHVDRHGVRPRAIDAFHAEIDLRSIRRDHGSWMGFLENEGFLDPHEQRAYRHTPDFFDHLDVSSMTKSFKMITLLAMLNQDAIPGAIELRDLAREFARLARRNANLRREVAVDLDDETQLTAYIRKNPVNAWASGSREAGPFFAVDGSEFRFANSVPDEDREIWQELTRELAEWRLAESMRRTGSADSTGQARGRVRVRDGSAVLDFTAEASEIALPVGQGRARHKGRDLTLRWEGPKVVAALDDGQDVLKTLVVEMFGSDAGLPGRRDEVVLDFDANPPELLSADEHERSEHLKLWKSYTREEIRERLAGPGRGYWQQGIVSVGDRLVLLVTLEKDDLPENHRYSDHFESDRLFHWQTQRQTTRHGKHGRRIQNAGPDGAEVYLFVRRAKKVGGVTQPFVYCGRPKFVKWEGEKPINVVFELEEPVPDSTRLLDT